MSGLLTTNTTAVVNTGITMKSSSISSPRSRANCVFTRRDVLLQLELDGVIVIRYPRVFNRSLTNEEVVRAIRTLACPLTQRLPLLHRIRWETLRVLVDHVALALFHPTTLLLTLCTWHSCPLVRLLELRSLSGLWIGLGAFGYAARTLANKLRDFVPGIGSSWPQLWLVDLAADALCVCDIAECLASSLAITFDDGFDHDPIFGSFRHSAGSFVDSIPTFHRAGNYLGTIGLNHATTLFLPIGLRYDKKYHTTKYIFWQD